MRYIETLKQHTYTPNDYYDYLARVEDAMVGDMAFLLPASSSRMLAKQTMRTGMLWKSRWSW